MVLGLLRIAGAMLHMVTIGSVAKAAPGSFGDASAANVFTAEDDELLRAVSAVTVEPDSTVQLQVYLLDKKAQGPTDGQLVTSQTEAVSLSGYHTIELDDPIELSAGQRFSVVETIEGSRGSYLPLEIAGHDPSDPDEEAAGFVLKKQQTAVANAGESFYSTDGGTTWTDVTVLTADDLQGRVSLSIFGGQPDVLGVGNAMIKAFTVNSEASDTPVSPGGSSGSASDDNTVHSSSADGGKNSVDSKNVKSSMQVDKTSKLAVTGDLPFVVPASLAFVAIATGGMVLAVRLGKRKGFSSS